MKRFFSLLAALAIGSLLSAQEFDGQSCTSIMVGRKASTDGSVMTSHTCDGRYRTWAQIEPAADHAPGTMHPVLRGTMHTSFRGDTTGVKLMGEIPEVTHTYAYLNTAYPSPTSTRPTPASTRNSWPSAKPLSAARTPL